MVRMTVLSIIIFFTVSTSLYPDIINIPADYPSIQEGIDAAVNGDTVLVAPGTYVENINFLGKAITVESSDGAEATIIDGNQANRVIQFLHGESLDSVLDGFTVCNGFVLYFGGGICCSDSSPTITNNIILENSCSAGGGIFCEKSSSPTITYNQIASNQGGGIYCIDSSPIISNNIIGANSSEYGGGIYCKESSPVIENNSIYWNSADRGGGIYCYKSLPIIKSNTILGNISYETGGGIYCVSGSNPPIIFNTIEENSSASGGGIYCSSSSPAIEYNFILGNSSGENGGGIYCRTYSSPSIKYNSIMDNSSSIGGGIYCFNSSPIIENTIITGNSAQSGGGIYCFYWSYPLVTNTTITGNSADIGGGIYIFKWPEPILTNTILWDNSALIGPEISIGTEKDKPTSLTISHSIVKGGQAFVYIEPECTLNWGEGMIDSDPLFAEPEQNDFHLTFGSPCRDSGYDSAPTERNDFEGDPRIAWSQRVDIGADEYYTHLYVTGSKKPGGNIQVKIVGLPETTPVDLIIGSDVRKPPVPTSYGLFHLLPPTLVIPLIPIPSDGILVIPFRIPTSPPAPYDIPMQGLVGLNSDSLTNLCVLEVR